MVDTANFLAYPSLILSDNAHRCRYCGQGPVMAVDGHLMDRCANCGSWGLSSGSGLDLGPILAKLRLALGSAWRRLVGRRTSKIANASGPSQVVSVG